MSLMLTDKRKEQRLNDLPDIPSKVDAAFAALETSYLLGEVPPWPFLWFVLETYSAHSHFKLPLAPQFGLAFFIKPIEPLLSFFFSFCCFFWIDITKVFLIVSKTNPKHENCC